jgi:hypothetical protein
MGFTRRCFLRWARKSIEEFSNNLAELPTSPQRDRSVEVLLRELKSSETLERKQWLDFIESDDARRRLSKEIDIPF